MSAVDEALARLGSNYYNPNPATPDNPGGLGGYGYVTNLFKLKDDLALVIGYIRPAAGMILSVSETAGAAQAAADDAFQSFNATRMIAELFKALPIAEIWKGTNNDRYLSALGLFNAAASTPLAWSATVTPSRLAGWNRHVTVTGHTVFANPTDYLPGQSGRLRITVGGAGGWTAGYGSAWRFPLGYRDISGGAGSVDILSYFVHAPDDIEAVLVRGFA